MWVSRVGGRGPSTWATLAAYQAHSWKLGSKWSCQGASIARCLPPRDSASAAAVGVRGLAEGGLRRTTHRYRGDRSPQCVCKTQVTDGCPQPSGMATALSRGHRLGGAARSPEVLGGCGHCQPVHCGGPGILTRRPCPAPPRLWTRPSRVQLLFSRESNTSTQHVHSKRLRQPGSGPAPASPTSRAVSTAPGSALAGSWGPGPPGVGSGTGDGLAAGRLRPLGWV